MNDVDGLELELRSINSVEVASAWGMEASSNRPHEGGAVATSTYANSNSSGENSPTELLTPVRNKHRANVNRVYTLLMVTQILLYAESGSIPAVLVHLTQAFQLTFPEQGILGGIVYVGIAVGAPMSSFLFSRYGSKKTLIASIVINAVIMLVFGAIPTNATFLLIVTRFFMGVTQASLVVYGPVWVDAFGRKDKQTQWFAWLQLTVSIGIMFGYLLGWVAVGMQHAVGEEQKCFGGLMDCWRFPFYLQGMLTLPLAIAFCRIPSTDLDITHRNKRKRRVERALKRQHMSSGNMSIRDTNALLEKMVSNQDIEDIERQLNLTPNGSSFRKGRGNAAGKSRDGSPSSITASPGSEGSSSKLDATGLKKKVRTPKRRNSPSPSVVSQDSEDGFSGSVWDPNTDRICGLRCPCLPGDSVQYCLDAFSEFKAVVCEFWFTTAVFNLTAMYFVVMTIQYWVTDYLIRGRGYSENAVMLSFVITNATAPILGVVIGGKLIDSCGGYQTVLAKRRTSAIVFSFQAGAVAFAVPCTLWPEGGLVFAVVCVWGILFCGGAAVPPLTGIFMDSIPSKSKTMGSSIAAVTFNMLAYLGSPLISGFLMDGFESALADCRDVDISGKCPAALEQGFRVALMAAPLIATVLTGFMWMRSCFEVNKREGVGISSDDPGSASNDARTSRTDSSVSLTLSNYVDSDDDEDDGSFRRGGNAMAPSYSGSKPILRGEDGVAPESPPRGAIIDSDEDVKNSLLVRPTSAERTGSAESGSSSSSSSSRKGRRRNAPP